MRLLAWLALLTAAGLASCGSEDRQPGAAGDEGVLRFAMERLNGDGGAIAIGHPVGASGARIVLHALKALAKRDGQRALATICIGGGQGGAMLLERVS